MPEKFMDRTGLTFGQWFWSRLGLVLGIITVVLLALSLLHFLITIASMGHWTLTPDENHRLAGSSAFAGIGVVMIGLFGFLATWCCVVFSGGMNPMGQKPSLWD